MTNSATYLLKFRTKPSRKLSILFKVSGERVPGSIKTNSNLLKKASLAFDLKTLRGTWFGDASSPFNSFIFSHNCFLVIWKTAIFEIKKSFRCLTELREQVSTGKSRTSETETRLGDWQTTRWRCKQQPKFAPTAHGKKWRFEKSV